MMTSWWVPAVRPGFWLRAGLVLLLMLSACTRQEPAATTGVGTPSALELETSTLPSGGEMVLIPSGNYVMGDANGAPDETPHQVAVSSFYMDKYPVTQAHYEEIMGLNPSKRRCDSCPVDRTRWTDAALFCNRCSELDGLVPCYAPQTWLCDFAADGYRLPTEAEWEYACRAGSNDRYCFGNDASLLPRYAWCKPRSRGRPRPVGQKLPNQWGLYDMHGNVWEWCNDYYSPSYYQESTATDPIGPAAGKQRVLRGGAWNAGEDRCRSSCRFRELPVFSDACFGADAYGFRRVRRAPSSADAGSGAAGNDRRVVETQNAGERAAPPALAISAKGLPAKTPLQEPPAAGAPAEGSIAPDRHKGTIAFVSDRSGSLDIWSMPAGSDEARQLTNDEYPDADPRFSPDGTQLLYTSLRDGFPQVWTMKRDGTQPRWITDGAQGQWSPDGQRIVFVREAQVYIRDLQSGDEHRITPESWQRCGVPAFSPDGRKVALASRHLGDIGIFIVETTGSMQRQLKTEDPCCTPCWSADGKRMLFQTVKGHIHQLDLADGSEEQLTFGADIQHDACYSPDGTMVVFCRAPSADGPWQLCILDLNSEDLDVVQITHEGSNRLPDWHSF